MLGVREYTNLNLTVYRPKAGRIDQCVGITGVNRWATIGDLHGNALTLLAFLHLEDIANVLAAPYDRAVALYQEAQSNFRQVRAEAVNGFFNEVLPQVTVTAGSNFRSLGDMLGDRGANDIYTLSLVGKLIDGGANVEIILSNHDALFIKWMEAKLLGKRLESWKSMNPGQADSLKRLDELVRLRVIKDDHLLRLYNQYKQTLKLLSYDYNEKGQLVLYSHAHLDERDVLLMASGLSEEYGDNIPEPLKTELTDLCMRLNEDETAMISEKDTKLLVDKINLVIRDCADRNALTQLLDLNRRIMNPAQVNGNGVDPSINPIYYSIWNRDNIDQRVQDRPKNPHIINAHGHHTYQQNYALCFDNRFARRENNPNGGDLRFMWTSPVNVLNLKFTQLMDMMQYLFTKKNMMVDQNGNVYSPAASASNQAVNMICFHLMGCFTRMPNQAELENFLVQHSEEIQDTWGKVNNLIERESHPSAVQKLERAMSDRATERSQGPKATTNGVVQFWSEHKERHEATVLATAQQHPNRHTN